MTLSLDEIALGVPDVQAAHAFYATVLGAGGDGENARIDLHGTGAVGLQRVDTLAANANAEPSTSGFRGYVVSYVVRQPSEVEALTAAAVQGGARVLKAPKKSLFGAFSAVCQAPDGSVWKLAAPTKKDTGAPAEPPRPTETVVILGVADPKASRAFYAALGMTVDRDYGSKYVDFRATPGTCRLGLMRRTALAKDAGVDADGSGFRAVVFDHRAESRAELDALLATVPPAGGHVTVAASEREAGGCRAQFTDLDGHIWNVASL